LEEGPGHIQENNILNHGSYNDDIDWGDIFINDTRKRGFKENKNKYLCPICFAYITNIYTTKCNVCSTIITPSTLKKIEFECPEHIKNKRPEELEWDEIEPYRKYKGYAAGWAWHLRQNLKMKKTISRLNR
jgi:hypothetical protein